MAEFHHYFSFKGRATRQEFWKMKPWVIACLLPGMALDAEADHSLAMTIVSLLLYLLGMWLEFAVAVRRVHDLDYRGWWLLGGIYVWLGFVRGTVGPNRFGHDPLSS